jgi:hypothetical protein
MSILLVVALGILPLGVMAVTATENEGHLVARSTEYSQDKLEQLLGLAYGDATTDTRVFPAAATGGTGLVSEAARTGGARRRIRRLPELRQQSASVRPPLRRVVLMRDGRSAARSRASSR